MADKNFLIKNGLTVGSTERISSAGVITGSLSGSLASATTATTQSASDNSTKIATTAYTDAAITALVDSSPGALNTLNELAAAMGDDASFSTTVTNSIATKAPLATPQFTNRVGIGVAAHGTAGLNITSTAQHMRLNNGSELGIISLESGGALNIWSHGDSSNNEIKFYQGSGSGSESMRIHGNGNVGIGQNNPSTKLDVDGIVSADNIALGGATVANGYEIEVSAVSSGNIIRSTRGSSVFAAYQSNNSHVYLGTTSDNEFRIIQNDGTALTIDTDRKVGIGTTSPDHPLEVVGVISSADSGVQKGTFANVGNDLVLTANAGQTNVSSNIIFKSSQSGGSATERMRIASNGYLVAQSASQVRLVLGSTGNSSNNTSNWIRGTGNELGLNSGGGNTSFEVNGTLKMRIRSDGGVAIGNNNVGYSSQILSVKAAAADTVFYGESTDTKCIMSVRDGDSTSNIGFGATGNAHVFSQDGAEIARISSGSGDKYPTSGQNAGFGGAGSNLHLSGDDSEIRMANNLIHSDNSGLTKFSIRAAYGSYSTGAELSLDGGYISFNTGTSFTERMRMTDGGTLVIGQQSASGLSNSSNTYGHTLGGGQQVNATNNDTNLILNRSNGSGTMITFRNNGGTIGSISQNGSVMTYGGTSDYRLKENVADMTNATTKLKQLKPKKFNYISDTTNTLYDGFLAHEVATVVPDAVVGSKDAIDSDGAPEYQMMDNSKLVPLLVKTIQELEARIATLEG